MMVEGEIYEAVGVLVSLAPDMMIAHREVLGDVTNLGHHGLEIRILNLIDAIHLLHGQLGVHVAVDLGWLEFEGFLDRAIERGVFGLIVRSFPQVFADFLEHLSLIIDHHAPDGHGAGIAAGSAVSVGGEVGHR